MKEFLFLTFKGDYVIISNKLSSIGCEEYLTFISDINQATLLSERRILDLEKKLSKSDLKYLKEGCVKLPAKEVRTVELISRK